MPLAVGDGGRLRHRADRRYRRLVAGRDGPSGARRRQAAARVVRGDVLGTLGTISVLVPLYGLAGLRAW